MNNKDLIFKSFILTKLYVALTGGKNITQGPYVVKELIQKFSGKEYTPQEMKREIASVAFNYGKYGFHVDEYFIYDVKGLSDFGKRRFINEETRWDYYNRLNDANNLELFDNKGKTYALFGKYYKRELIIVKSGDDISRAEEFFNTYDGIILKPLGGSGGKGVRRLKKGIDTPEALLQEFKAGFVAEPVIRNIEEIAEFHRDSLNTVRVATVRMDDRVEIAFAFARFGRDGKCVDNAAAGGLFCDIDINTGVIYAVIDKNRNHFIVHPNSGKQLLGYRIPKWTELKVLVQELAYVVPTNRYTGWDLALTEDGWLLVEANARGQFVSQMPDGKGIKKQFDRYLEELHL